LYKCAQWSAVAESEALDKALSGSERLLEIVGLEVMAEDNGTHSEGWRERVPDCIGAATLKLRAPNSDVTDQLGAL